MAAPFDALVAALEEYEERPYAILMGRRDWRELIADKRARDAIMSVPGDPPCFMRIPVRIEGRRATPRVFRPRIFRTAQDLHDELYEGNVLRKRRRY